MRIELDGLALRPPEPGDAPRLAQLANDRAVWRNLRDAFPHPYTLEHAQQFISRNLDPSVTATFIIEVDGLLAGACGAHRGTDVYARSAEVGYWLSPAARGRGVATKAVTALSRYAFEVLGVSRLQASVYAWNPASMRVLEKAGYEREGVLRASVFKDGQLIDAVLFAKLAR